MSGSLTLSAAEIEALLLSLRVAGVALLIGLPLAIWTAWTLATRNFPGKPIVLALIHAPLVIPPVVTGYLLLMALGPRSALGGWLETTLGISFAFNWLGAALAAMIMAFPLMVRAIRLSFESEDRRLNFAARSLGASPTRAFFRVSLPLATPGILAGGILGFARALGEFGATITFVASIPGLTQTLPLALYGATQLPGGEAGAARLLVLSLLLALGALIAAEYLAWRMKDAREAR